MLMSWIWTVSICSCHEQSQYAHVMNMNSLNMLMSWTVSICSCHEIYHREPDVVVNRLNVNYFKMRWMYSKNVILVQFCLLLKICLYAGNNSVPLWKQLIIKYVSSGFRLKAGSASRHEQTPLAWKRQRGRPIVPGWGQWKMIWNLLYLEYTLPGRRSKI